jgi:hypothetical protein
VPRAEREHAAQHVLRQPDDLSHDQVAHEAACHPGRSQPGLPAPLRVGVAAQKQRAGQHQRRGEHARRQRDAVYTLIVAFAEQQAHQQ